MHRVVSILSFFMLQVAFGQFNSSYDEQGPVLSPDGRELYFTIAHHPQNAAGKRDLGDVWVSRFEDGKWLAPIPVRGLINNSGFNAVLGFSASGEEMYLYGHYAANGDAGASQGIAVSTRNAGGWSLPINETVPFFLNRSVATGGQIASDKSFFVYSALGRPFDSFGNEDLYVSLYRDGQWQEPFNLGAVLSTEYQEFTPFFEASSNTLFFVSNKPGGQGSFDIYASKRLDDTWKSWSPPQPVGSAVNSVGRELWYGPYGSVILYTSTHNSDGFGDIHQLKVAQTQPIVFQKEAEPSSEATSKVKSTVSVRGRVTNAVSGVGIAATLHLVPKNQPEERANAEGFYAMEIVPGKSFAVEVKSDGHIPLNETFPLSGDVNSLMEINFQLQPIEVGVSVNLKHVLFKQSSSELLPESNDALDHVVAFMKGNPSVEIELSGHTDNSGKAALNLKLSRDRVVRIQNYLVEQGIAGNRIKFVGYGETRPLAPNTTEEGRRMNRRVEFKITKK